MTALAMDQRTDRAQRIVNHLVERFSSSKVVDEPFQHFATENAFPDDVYEDIRASLPGREAYLPINIKQWKNAEGQSTRDRILLSDAEMQKIPAATRQIWEDIRAALASPEFQKVVYSALRKDIALRLNIPESEVPKQKSYVYTMITRDFEDYSIKPHPDGQPRVVTMMFYLAKKNDPKDLGTSIYRERPMLNRLLGNRFEEVGRFPFLPNSAGTFVVNSRPDRTSWHGRELIKGANTVRDSIIVSFLSKEMPEFGSRHNY
jgi:hypothetical protein